MLNLRRERTGSLFLALVVVSVPIFAQPAALSERMIRAEDTRAQTAADLDTLRQGLTDADARLRRQAVRALGRLERPELIAELVKPLADADPDVRAEAANAIGQSVTGGTGVADAKAQLVPAVKREKDPRVWGAIAATLGRLRYASAADVDEVETLVAQALPGAAAPVRVDALLGAVEGLEAMSRVSLKLAKPKAATLDGLYAAATFQDVAGDADKAARVRRLTLLALISSGAVTRARITTAAADRDDEVRRLAMLAARAAIDGRDAVVTKGLIDPNPRVRYEALQTFGRQAQKTSCDPVSSAVRDANAHVSLLAIDLLGNGCPASQSPLATLQALAGAVTAKPGEWHKPAHAIVSLARVAPAEARKLLPRYVAHATWQVRMYAAHAAGVLAAIPELEALARDAHDNVREAAVGELATLKRPEAVRAAIEALGRPDYQLAITAARALSAVTEPPQREAAVAALNAAALRIRGANRDTARDALNAIADRLKALGASPPIAFAALPMRPPAVTAADLTTLARTRLRFTMARRGTFDVQLLPGEAAVTSYHIAKLAREGYYNGLTFHRVAPNFVIQGGSPGANEYMGQGPFMRDEVGLASHRRGTVGISTRGRDTGDAQIFVNLIDSPRLDHTYTVFAEVVAGMEVVDSIIEGDLIERVDVIVSK